MKSKYSSLRNSLFTVCLAIPLPSLALAASITWQGGSSTDFALDGNWVPNDPNPAMAPANDLISDVATFSAPAAFQPDLFTGSRSVNGLDFQSSDWILGDASGLSTLTLGSGGISNNGNNSITPTLVQSGSATYTLTSGTLSLNKITGNTVTFSGGGSASLGGLVDNDSFSPIVTSGATLIVNKGNGGAGDFGSSVNNLTVDAGATVKFGANRTSRPAGSGRGQIYNTATINGTMDLNGQGLTSSTTNNWIMGGLAGAGIVTNNGTGSAELGVRGGTFSGQINDGSQVTSLLVASGTFNYGGGGNFSGTITTQGVLNLNDNLLGGGNYSGVIGGTGAVNLGAAGKTQILSGANTYYGQTLITAGTLKLVPSTVLGGSVDVTVTTTGGVTTVPANSPIAIGMFVTGPGLAADTRVTGYTAASGAVTLVPAATADGVVTGTFSGATQVNNGGVLDLNGQTVTERILNLDATTDGSLINSDTVNPAAVTTKFGGTYAFRSFTVGGPGAISLDTVASSGSTNRILTKNGTGKLTMGGTGDNFRFSLTMDGGTAVLNKSTTGRAFNNIILNTGLVQYGPNNTDGSAVGQTNAVTINGGVFDLNGSTNILNTTIGNLNAAAAGGIIVNNANNGSTTTLSIGAGNNQNNTGFAGVIADNNNGGTGKMALIKTGNGTQILTGANTYTGNTTVNNGTLSLGTAYLANSSTVTIANTAFLNLTHGQVDQVTALVIGTNPPLADGTYGAVGSADPDDIETPRITGTGQIKVQSAVANDYSTWAALYPSEDLSDKAGDNDHDGLTNQQEYAYGLNPTSGSSVNPILTQVDKATGIFTYQRRASTDLTYEIYTSSTLAEGSWMLDEAATNGQVEGDADGNGNQTVTVTLTGAPLTEPKLFIRVKAD